MKNFERAVMFIAVLLLGVSQASAQVAESDTLYQVRLTDGSTVVGQLESRTADLVVLVTTSGVRMEIATTKIREMRAARGRLVKGEYWAPDPNRTRLFFAPTGRAIGAGRGYVGTFFIALPFVAYGVGDHITLSGGAPILLGQLQPFYIAPKITLVETPAMALAAGVLAVWSFDSDDFDDGFGVAFGLGTFGSADHAVTTGIGFGYAGNDVSGQPAIMLAGETRVGRRTKLISENYFVTGETGGVLTGGLRILGERLSVDVGVLTAIGGGERFCCAPIVNFSYSFGKPH